MPNKYEQFAAAYLRLNGYFTVPNFIIHAGNDPDRVVSGIVGNYTETDIISIRMPNSREHVGQLAIANHDAHLGGAASNGMTDVVVVEVKSGDDTRPNRVCTYGERRELIAPNTAWRKSCSDARTSTSNGSHGFCPRSTTTL